MTRHQPRQQEEKMEIALLNNQTWLICGGRDFANQHMFDTIMNHLTQTRGCPAKVVHGGASGADSMAGAWAKKMAVEVVACPADWKKHGKAAGPIRNEEMLMDHKPSLVVAFPGGQGTADMVKRANRRVLDVVEVRPPKTVMQFEGESLELKPC
jgi:hypothetical protein